MNILGANLGSLLDIFVGVTNSPLLGDFCGLGNKFVVDARLDVSPGAGYAALASIGERGSVCDFGSLVNCKHKLVVTAVYQFSSSSSLTRLSALLDMGLSHGTPMSNIFGAFSLIYAASQISSRPKLPSLYPALPYFFFSF